MDVNNHPVIWYHRFWPMATWHQPVINDGKQKVWEGHVENKAIQRSILCPGTWAAWALASSQRRRLLGGEFSAWDQLENIEKRRLVDVSSVDLHPLIHLSLVGGWPNTLKNFSQLGWRINWDVPNHQPEVSSHLAMVCLVSVYCQSPASQLSISSCL